MPRFPNPWLLVAGTAGLVLNGLADRMPPFATFICSLAVAGLAAVAAGIVHPGLFYVASGAVVALVFPANFIFATTAIGPGPRTAPIVMAACLVGGIVMPSRAAPVMAATGADAFAAMGALALATAATGALFRAGLTRRAGASLPDRVH